MTHKTALIDDSMENLKEFLCYDTTFVQFYGPCASAVWDFIKVNINVFRV